MALNYYCVDAGSSYCPCHLAKIDSCLICSLLQGKETCDCKWQGLCIYQEYIWNGKKIQNQRKCLLTKIEEKKMVSENILLIKIVLPSSELLTEYDQPSAFAFLRGVGTPEYYDVPLCVMDVDESKSILTFAVHIIGPKTKFLVAESEEILLRGPYFNGLFGIKHIKASFEKNWLLLGGGIGQVSVIPVAKNLLRGNNNVTVMLDPSHLKVNLAGAKLKEIGIPYHEIDVIKTSNKSEIGQLIEQGALDYIYSAGSDIQHKTVEDIIKKSGFNIPLIISNNNQLCCGEGICGSCGVSVQGEVINLCKIQLDSKNVLGV